MTKRIILLLSLLAVMLPTLFGAALAVVEDEEEISVKLGGVKAEYEPGKSYFVSNSTKKWVGEDNIAGDKTLGCFAPGTTNSHGRFGGLWQSMGFANYVFYTVFGEMPQFGYHCNPGELNENMTVIGRYASDCRYLRGEKDGDISEYNIQTLLSSAKQGDILVVSPKKNCNRTGKAMVIMSVTEGFVTVYHADYKGNCAVTEDTVSFEALKDYHCITLLRSAAYPYPQPVPPGAVQNVSVSATDLSLNESVNITWDKVKNADTYNVTVKDEKGNAVMQSECGTGIISFVFTEAGVYTAEVTASNAYGDGTAVISEKICVHNRNKVRFIDHDGTVITEQTVEYGKKATAPSVPMRKGYRFAGWDKSLENITVPTDISATYQVEKYVVKYYDVGGKNVLSAESVEYLGKANPPTNYTISEGYVFSGWQISFDSQGTDYNCVDGDMVLIATQKWANLNLPVSITVNNAFRDETATYYSADIVLKNHDTSGAKKFKVIATLKASDGKALKIVVLDEVSLNAGETKTLYGRTIVYSQKATSVEVTAVGMVGNSKTGGAFSKTVSSAISDNSSWGSWTEWTSENKISSYDDYETKTQYRYRNKVYTTATSSTLSGWTKYNTTESVGGWSDWYNYSISSFTNDAQKREVKSRYIQPTYKTQYHYYHYCKGTSSIWTHASSGGTFHDLWVDSKLPFYKNLGGMDWYKGEGCSGRNCKYWFICDGTTYGGPGPWTRQVKTGGDYYQYAYRDTYYTYYFWKWGDWSEWSDTYKAGDETETRTLYRYRNRSESGDAEDISGEFFTVSGSINNVESDFSGMTAAVMVYKKCNTDPTEEQLEYVGQTVLGENNTYSFTFKPKEMPSGETGAFIVALGIEGADRLVNVDVIEADVATYNVKFIADGEIIYDPNASDVTDSDGNRFRVQIVKEGECAIAPLPPEKEGYTFVKWSETLTGIRTDKVITAEYEPNEYSIVFIDWENGSVTSCKHKYGDTIVYPELEAVVGSDVRKWDKQLEGIEIVTGNMIIGSVAQPNFHTVTFMDGDTVVSVQTAAYGHKAEIPDEEPHIEGMEFVGWVGNCSTEYITQDVIFTPAFLYSKTVSMPQAEVSTAQDGSSTVRLTCDTEGATIYYVIENCGEHAQLNELEGGIWEEYGIELMEDDVDDGSGENAEITDGFRAYAIPYTGEITLCEGETLTFIAYADGMNESIPVSESSTENRTSYGVAVEESSLRQYRNSVEGSLRVTVSNDLPEYEYGTVTLCFYDHRGVMIDIIPQSVEIVPGENTVEFNDIKLSGRLVENAEAVYCRITSWLEGETVIPISDYVLCDVK